MTPQYDPADPMVLRTSSESTDDVLAALATGHAPDGGDDLSPDFSAAVRDILADPRGQMTLEVSGNPLYQHHSFTLARAGVLRRSRASERTNELAVFPTTVLPGVLLRLAPMVPLEPLEPSVRLTVPADLLSQLWTSDWSELSDAWNRIRELTHDLPAAADSDADALPLRAVRATRAPKDGQGDARTFVALVLRGRYLIAEHSGLGTSLVGTDPTTVARGFFSLLVSQR